MENLRNLQNFANSFLVYLITLLNFICKTSQQTQPKLRPKNYDTIWQENPDGFGLPRESLVLEVLKNLPKNAKIAEIASGNGRYALVLTERLQNLEN